MTRILLLASILTACVINEGDTKDDVVGVDAGPSGNVDEDAGPSGNVDAGPSGGGDFDPTSGAWDYGEFTTVANTCNTNLIEGNNGGFGLLNNGDGTFTVTPSDGTGPFDCSLSANAYNCEETILLSQEIGTAQIVGRGSISGTFSSDNDARGTRVLDITCSGAGCLTLQTTGATFPCVLNVNFTASLTSGG